jgi:hypothetical protein
LPCKSLFCRMSATIYIIREPHPYNTRNENFYLCLKKTHRIPVTNRESDIHTVLSLMTFGKVTTFISEMYICCLWPEYSINRRDHWIFPPPPWRTAPCKPHCRDFTTTRTHTTLGRTSWRNDRSVAETCTWQATTLTIDIHACPGGIRTFPVSERPRGHWDVL